MFVRRLFFVWMLLIFTAAMLKFFTAATRTRIIAAYLFTSFHVNYIAFCFCFRHSFISPGGRAEGAEIG